MGGALSKTAKLLLDNSTWNIVQQFLTWNWWFCFMYRLEWRGFTAPRRLDWMIGQNNSKLLSWLLAGRPWMFPAFNLKHFAQPGGPKCKRIEKQRDNVETCFYACGFSLFFHCSFCNWGWGLLHTSGLFQGILCVAQQPVQPCYTTLVFVAAGEGMFRANSIQPCAFCRCFVFHSISWYIDIYTFVFVVFVTHMFQKTISIQKRGSPKDLPPMDLVGSSVFRF